MTNTEQTQQEAPKMDVLSFLELTQKIQIANLLRQVLIILNFQEIANTQTEENKIALKSAIQQMYSNLAAFFTSESVSVSSSILNVLDNGNQVIEETEDAKKSSWL